ncbi:MAG: hypothetical protein BAJALOKI1v1_1240009 [Promethearchaeota archaeon]|nr:MAG: hypothetical protein BAJALOKI1v1_1240009 [Candidatus Lokiarchaeota archaeon]
MIARKEDLVKIQDTLEMKIPFHDTDVAGWVYHSNYLKYGDEGFIHFFEKKLCISTLQEVIDSSIVFPVRTLTIEYKSPAKFGEVVLITTQITSIGTTSFNLTQEIRKKENDALLATIESTRVIFNVNTKHPQNALEFFRACTVKP